jgi:hypothetical protein
LHPRLMQVRIALGRLTGGLCRRSRLPPRRRPRRALLLAMDAHARVLACVAWNKRIEPGGEIERDQPGKGLLDGRSRTRDSEHYLSLCQSGPGLLETVEDHFLVIAQLQ